MNNNMTEHKAIIDGELYKCSCGRTFKNPHGINVHTGHANKRIPAPVAPRPSVKEAGDAE
jgi:hypothetical protein